MGFDGARWFDAVAPLRTPVEAPAYPGRRFRVQCADIAEAVATLARSNARMLAALAWRGTEVERVSTRWRPDQFVEIAARMVARANPWTGIPGCIYLGNALQAALHDRYFVGGPRGPTSALCTRAEMLGSPAIPGMTHRRGRIAGEPTPTLRLPTIDWKVPPSLGVLLQPLATLQRPTGELYRAYTEKRTQPATRRRLRLRRRTASTSAARRSTSASRSTSPSIPAAGARAADRRLLHRPPGRLRALGMRRKEDAGQGVGHRMLEHAMVRMAAIAIVDVATGRIEALAGALSPCTRHEYDGPGLAPGCDKRLPYPSAFAPTPSSTPPSFTTRCPPR